MNTTNNLIKATSQAVEGLSHGKFVALDTAFLLLVLSLLCSLGTLRRTNYISGFKYKECKIIFTI